MRTIARTPEAVRLAIPRGWLLLAFGAAGWAVPISVWFSFRAIASAVFG